MKLNTRRKNRRRKLRRKIIKGAARCSESIDLLDTDFEGNQIGRCVFINGKIAFIDNKSKTSITFKKKGDTLEKQIIIKNDYERVIKVSKQTKYIKPIRAMYKKGE